MNLIDVDVIGSEPAQGILDLPQDAGTAGIARYLSTVPLKSGLGGNKHVRAQPAFGDRPANNLLGAAESIGRRRVDNVDAMLECGPDGGDRFGFVGSTPHPSADGPGADRDRRYLERCAGNLGKLHFRFESFCLIGHDPVPSSITCALNRVSGGLIKRYLHVAFRASRRSAFPPAI